MKIIIILPLIAILSACSMVNKTSKPKATHSSDNVVIEDRNRVDAIVSEQAVFEWDKSKQSATITAGEGVLSPTEKAVSVLKSSGAVFNLNFDFNDVEISEAASKEILKHVLFLQDNPAIELTLKGHADQRGTREYNLALGENRGLSVKKVMDFYEGIEGRIEVISYGEEKPLSMENNETGWKLNRRVEFVYE
ncbi:18K peptidoglycan-associated outer membrane lipoprotein; Peptidoglycan-associated lipoprotein precursor; Outer membrane protein P6; OmpA/MotB precursor [uncultured Candidatus Thioglobus sp.]|nr:18K peptidoglycan-associated outer membrane lipoprotein; Peptidoglycan-associated lipoprotein precursor; Outer membrane protein P6; OmpA/MotB precursor [uncultured Candidatus Thioglobus sp.]SMM99114.1 18K peptidoglycan-associated outer membrane lipoprotein; Peptidoglycan-associated lipoprotein precursor; Outer membrane protein P6; OmpA/MotB precursor [uncultured Candidatus Thioglobus sp.]